LNGPPCSTMRVVLGHWSSECEDWRGEAEESATASITESVRAWGMRAAEPDGRDVLRNWLGGRREAGRLLPSLPVSNVLSASLAVIGHDHRVVESCY